MLWVGLPYQVTMCLLTQLDTTPSDHMIYNQEIDTFTDFNYGK